MTEKNGAQIMVNALIKQGVTTIFGYPGGSVLKFYDELFHNRSKINHILTRHEQGAAHAAEGYAKSTGNVGVVVVTSGPGTTNLVTGIADAYLDSVPLVCICGQVASNLIGTDAFQEVDTNEITKAISKHNYLIKKAEDIDKVIQEAFLTAKTGRPGPVIIAIPSDVQAQKIDYVESSIDNKIIEPAIDYHELDEKISSALKLIENAKKPLLYCGGGVTISGKAAVKELHNLAKTTNMPVTLTLMGLGVYPATDPQFIGMPGMHGTYEANKAMSECDLMIAIGARFDDRVTAKIDKFSPNSKKIQIDIDPSIINKNVKVDISLIGDAAHILSAINKKISTIAKKDLTEWWNTIDNWRTKKSYDYKASKAVIKPQYVIERLYELTRDIKPFIVTDVGQHQMFTAQLYKFEKARQLVTSGGLGTMGFGLPAAIGTKIANPDSMIICVSGDGSFMMNIQELATAKYYNIPIKVIILNNGHLGMVRQWQQLFCDKRYSSTVFEKKTDFVSVAKAFGCLGAEVSDQSNLDEAIKNMLESKDPFILNVFVDGEENVMPMILSGKAHHEMFFREDLKNE